MYNRLALVGIVVLGLVAGSAHAELVGHWRLNEGAGAIAYDSSGNGNDGAVQGEPEWVAGMLGGALLLNGVDDYVEIPHSQILTVDNEVTVMAWVNAEAYTGVGGAAYQGIIAKSNGPRSYSLYLQGAGTLHFSTAGAGSSSSETVPLNEWVHVTAQVAGGEHRYFLNGEAAGSGGSGIVLPGTADTANVLIGNTWEDNREFAGMIDDARIYNHALDETELQEAMTNIPFPLPMALALDPADGTMIGQPQYTLKWMGGDLAASHVVYLGESFDEVDQGLVEAVDTTEASLATTSIPAYAAGLTPGQTYYWRVDEVNDLHPESPWKGNVWSFQVQPLTAWNPSPADGMKYIPTDQQLTWEKGIGALFHTVYFGESLEEVRDAAADGFMTASASYASGPLQAETTYYWRVDEFAATGTTTKGELWGFTTVPEITVTDPTLLGWWTLDEGIGSTAVDWSGHGNHGALSGDPQWVDGYHGGALDFDGNDHVDTGDTTDLATWTIAVWVISPEAPGGGGASGPVHREKNYQFDWNHADEVFRGAAALCVEGTWHAASFGALEGNTWYHLAATFDGTALTSYKNGVLMVSNTAAAGTPDAETGTLLIGRHSTASGNYFTGTVDDVRVYDRALTEAEIAEAMRGNPLLAGSPNPGPGATVDIRDATMLSWAAGDTAASHDVYFGTDRAAVAAADNSTAEFQGNQPGTSASLAGLVEFGGGEYFWRIDEVEAAGTVQTGYIWRFMIPDYLIVDDFESYTNDADTLQRVFQTWIDGIGFSEPVDTPGNGTGALVGHDIWAPGTPYTQIVEIGNVFGGNQAMPIYYDNTVAPGISEADRTFTPGRNWTVEGVTTLVVHFRGEADNTGDLYVEINGVKVPYPDDPADIASGDWIAWEIDLASVGVSLTNVTTLTIGIEGDQTGVLYIDDVILTR